MPPRRSHKKSRAGCRRCKSRKIKCDEIRPRCYNCEKHGVACDFEFPELASEFAQTPHLSYASPVAPTPGGMGTMPPTPSMPSINTSADPFASLGPLPPMPTPTLSSTNPSLLSTSTSPAATRLLELRLLHHYVTTTCKTLSCDNPTAEDVWRDTVPRVAFAAACGSVNSASNHLTDAVLAVAALHLRSEFPQDRELVRASHAYMASSLGEYNRLLQKGINASNAEALFLNSTLIAFQSTATRIFSKDEPSTSTPWTSDASSAAFFGVNGHPNSRILPTMSIAAATGNYGLPMSWFHAFQGVKAVTAASWPWLRRSDIVLPIINAQPALHLDIASAREGFFGHLLDGLDEELALISSASSTNGSGSGGGGGGGGGGDGGLSRRDREPEDVQPSQQLIDILQHDRFHTHEDPDEAAKVRHAYQHAVAVLNWAHGVRDSSACLAFPATVSRRFVELLASRTPRALTILACFFAMLKSLDTIWWLHGMARREVLGVVSMFNSDTVPVDVERRWWPHMQWAVRVALYHDDKHPSNYVPPEVWGSPYIECNANNDAAAAVASIVPEAALPRTSANGESTAATAAATQPPRPETFGSHIDLITESLNNGGGGGHFNEFNFNLGV